MAWGLNAGSSDVRPPPGIGPAFDGAEHATPDADEPAAPSPRASVVQASVLPEWASGSHERFNGLVGSAVERVRQWATGGKPSAPAPLPVIPFVGAGANQAVMDAFDAPIFVDPLDPSGLSEGGWPSAEDIQQDSRTGGPGDCYLLATLAGMTTADPQGIKDSIRTVVDADGCLAFRVRFCVPDKTDPQKTVQVEVPVTVAEVRDNIENRQSGSALDNGKNTGLWPAIIETAWARQHTPEGQPLDHGYRQIDYGMPEDAILAMTGDRATTIPLARLLEEPAQTTFETLQKALDEKRIVTVGTHARKFVDHALAHGNAVPLPPQHDFTITRVGRDKNTGEMFVVFRDPERADGVTETRVPMKDFKSIAIARVVIGPSLAEVTAKREALSRAL